MVTASGLDGFDFDLGERLAVAVFLAVPFAAVFVEDDDFIAFHMTQHAGFHGCALDVGHAESHFAVVVEQVYGVEGNRISFIGCQPVDEDLLTFLNFKLLTGDGNDCEHIDNQNVSVKTSFLDAKRLAKV